MEDSAAKPVPQYSEWDVTFSSYIDFYILYFMIIVIGTIGIFTQRGTLQWLSLAGIFASIGLATLQIKYFHSKASRMTPQQRREYCLHKLEINREKEKYGI